MSHRATQQYMVRTIVQEGNINIIILMAGGGRRYAAHHRPVITRLDDVWR